MKRAIFGFAALGASIAGLLVLGQGTFPAALFEFGQYRTHEGVIESWPYPMLITSSERYLLVGQGKHGFESEGFDGKSVRLRGSLISRGEGRMLEVDSVEALGDAPHAATTLDLGAVELKGEIVDSKCYLGVMNPGSGKVHRGCAVRCISGGAPPAFIARDAAGETRLVLLAGSDGRALNKEVLDYVAEPIVVTGRLVRKETQLVLLAEPRDFRRE